MPGLDLPRLGLRRRIEAAATAHPLLRRALTIAHLARTDLVGGRRHPFDRRHGVRTQQPVPLHLTRTGSAADAHVIPYAGCVPSVLARVLDAISDPERFTFLDIGCGKGRALIVASERRFARVVGIELNPDVARIARRNARAIARRHPARAPIEVRTGDASAPDLPDGDLVVFLYHPFGRPLVDTLVGRLARSVGADRRIVVIYENPVHGEVLDAHPAFARERAEMVACTAEEAPFAFDAREAVAVWRSPGCGAPEPPSPIVVTLPGLRAVIAESASA